MSRIGKKPVAIAEGVNVSVADNVVSVVGPMGTLTFAHRSEVNVVVENGEVVVSSDTTNRTARELHGTTRATIANMIIGVKTGYEKRLEVVGVGYLCAISGKQLQLRVGFANELKKEIPAGLTVTCPDQTHVVVKGCDKQKVGQFAAEVRSLRKPEPYKGKGIRYQGEQVKIKAGKSAT